VARGTHVIWRNADELGEAHTVTADPGTWLLQFDSAWLEPDEQYELTFTERGQYSYYCQAHGAPEHGGMSGVVIVD
jgi:plastocyanin